MTATKAGNGPQMALVLAVDAYSLVDDELIVPFDTGAADNKAWLDSFYPAFMRNGQIDGRTRGIPFQRSTIVLYYNKDAFREAGLDPEQPPATWAEHAQFAQKLTRREGDRGDALGRADPRHRLHLLAVSGPGRGGRGGNSPMRTGRRWISRTRPASRRLQYWIDLDRVQHAHPPGIAEWGTTPRDFLEGRVAMIWTTTGNLSNIRANATFPFGVAMLPADKRRGSPTGGGNFHMFRSATPPQQAACLRFLQWLTSPERAAQWSIDTGYVAVVPAAWDTPAMKAYVAGFPQAAVARDQLQYAVPDCPRTTTSA